MKIPSIFHRCWVSGDDIPERFEGYWAELKRLHPQYEFMTWRGTEVVMRQQELYDAQTNFGAKSDILRLEVLRLFGGVYLDTDVEPLKALELEDEWKFFCSVRGGTVDNGIMGAPQGDPTLKLVLDNLSRIPAKPIHRGMITSLTGPGALIPLVQIGDIKLFPEHIYSCKPENVNEHTKAIHHAVGGW